MTEPIDRERMATRLDEHAVRYANDYGYGVASDLKRAAEMLRTDLNVVAAARKVSVAVHSTHDHTQWFQSLADLMTALDTTPLSEIEQRLAQRPTAEYVYACCESILTEFRDELTEQAIKLICDQISRKVSTPPPPNSEIEQRLARVDASLAKQLQNSIERNSKFVAALVESVKLQSHYAELLNMHDGGKRLTFANAKEWMDRLSKLENHDA